MSYFHIQGSQYGKSGTIPVYGAKNSAIKLIPATLLIHGEITLHNIPDIADVRGMILILESLGAQVTRIDHHSYHIDTRSVDQSQIPFDIAVNMRASFLFIAPLLLRFGQVTFPHPGGDAIGRRPIDMTLEILREMGTIIQEEPNAYLFSLPLDQNLQAIDYIFKWISHTSTELLIMAAVKAEGTTTIYNAAMEPEVGMLCHMLRQAGAHITGDGTPHIQIDGVAELSSVEVTNIPDRLEAASFAILGALTHSHLSITNIEPAHLRVFWKYLDMVGVNYKLANDYLEILPPVQDYQATDIKTHEYPGFVTDFQAPFTVLLTQAHGLSMVHETIFDGRLFYTDTLNRMGAQIIMCDPYRAVVNGSSQLYGQNIESPDVRAAMAFLLAALVAKRSSVIHNIHHIDRGYENIEKRLQHLGFEIVRYE